MRSRAEKGKEAQGAGRASLERVKQFLLPMVAGMAATKRDLLNFVHELGMEALADVFESDVLALAGEKGKHRADRTHHRWGSTPAELPFGGRRIRVKRPRVRAKSGREVTLPSVSRFQAEDPLPERVVEQILLGVSTRG